MVNGELRIIANRERKREHTKIEKSESLTTDNQINGYISKIRHNILNTNKMPEKK